MESMVVGDFCGKFCQDTMDDAQHTVGWLNANSAGICGDCKFAQTFNSCGHFLGVHGSLTRHETGKPLFVNLCGTTWIFHFFTNALPVNHILANSK